MKVFTTFVFLILCSQAFCQQRLHGHVTGPDGVPLSRATVFISESKNGTATDTLGNFVLTTLGKGSVKLVVSCIGYEAQVRAVSAEAADSTLMFVMKLVSKQLKDVVVTSRANDDWKHWGTIFTDAFIGGSAFAGNCKIINYQEIGFKYDKVNNELEAFANVPIVVKNESLGYTLKITLVDFILYTSNNDVDYQAYYLFEEMKGDAGQLKQWEQNRRKVYALSLMHFTRALYAGKLKEEGFEVRRFSIKDIWERARVANIYAEEKGLHADLFKNGEENAEVLDQLIAKRFGNDSLQYYKSILAKKDEEVPMSGLLKAGDFSVKGANNLSLNFKDALQVVYKKTKEPDEYYNNRNKPITISESVTISRSGINTTRALMPPKLNPYTELWLLKGQPVDVRENGQVNNTNLYLHGFWGWWEKIATKLPYEYYPD